MVRWLWKGLTYEQGLKIGAFLGSALQLFKRYNVNILQNDIDTHVIMLSIYAAPSHSCVGQGWMKFCITCSCSRRLSATFLITASLARFARNCETIQTVYIPVQQGSLTHSSGQNILRITSRAQLG